MIPQVIAHYRILRELGAGGMGRVYLGEDSRLGRRVAIKVLPAEYTRHADRLRRFEQEARAASALNHPNILTIHDVGEAGGAPYFVTELVEGETLRARMMRSPLQVAEALRIAAQVADALAAAHAAGIVHRDIKPENIMLRRDEWVKVLDFGLAKLADRRPPVSGEAPTVAQLETTPGIVLGTVSYMSPEQARGLAVDARTDIFSLGIVLYESIAGRRPFDGASTADVILSIVSGEPPPLASSMSDVPPELERVVFKALAKDRNERYQNAADLLADLRRLQKSLEIAAEVRQARRSSPEDATAPAVRVDGVALPPQGAIRPAQRRLVALALAVAFLGAAGAAIFFARAARGERIDTLAVLPFISAANDPDTEYLSDGITETLINRLSQLPDLKVISRSAVWRYKAAGETANAGAVARELGVRAILSGRLARRGERLAISTELVDARDDTQIWGENYDRSVADVLALQDDIAGRILETLRLELSGEERRRLTARDTDDSEAYDRYLRGRYFLARRSEESIHKAREFFREAIEEDPAYALAWSGVSDTYALLAAQAAVPPGEAYTSALAAAHKAIELDPSLAEGHASLAHAALHTRDFPLAEREFARAIDLKPGYLPAYQWQSEYLLSTGRRDQAFAVSRKALRIDPLDLAANAQLAFLLIDAGRYDEAVAQLEKTLEIDPHYFLAHGYLGTAYLRMGRFDDAIREFAITSRLTAGNRGEGGRGLALAMSGRRDDARRVAEALEARARTRYTSPMEIARIYGRLEDREKAVEWLRKAREEQPSGLGRLARDDDFAFLRGDEVLAELARPRE